MPTAHNVCTCAVFTTSFNFGLPAYLVSHYFSYTRVLYAVFYSFFKRKVEQNCFDCGVANDLSKATHMFVCIMLTPCFNFVWLCQRLVSLSFQKTTVHINFS